MLLHVYSTCSLHVVVTEHIFHVSKQRAQFHIIWHIKIRLYTVLTQVCATYLSFHSVTSSSSVLNRFFQAVEAIVFDGFHNKVMHNYFLPSKTMAASCFRVIIYLNAIKGEGWIQRGLLSRNVFQIDLFLFIVLPRTHKSARLLSMMHRAVPPQGPSKKSFSLNCIIFFWKNINYLSFQVA